MRNVLPVLPHDIETVAELRELYRASEARAARLRLLSASGRELAEAHPNRIDRILQSCADRLAYFVGRRHATVSYLTGAGGIQIPAPGQDGRHVGSVEIEGLASLEHVVDDEDRETVRMHLELMGATIDRICRERERAQLLATLQEREQRLEVLVGRLFSAQEEERRRVAHDLHDGVAQTVTALVRQLEGVSSAPSCDLPAADRLALAGIARGLLDELRGVIAGLRPTILDDLGLEASLRFIAEGLEADGYTTEVRISSDVERWPPNIETALFRVTQEAIYNIRKHAGGHCRVEIDLRADRDNGVRFLRIRDFGRGCGFPLPSSCDMPVGSRIGIDGMRERMTAIGGSLDWQAEKDGGVTVAARLPVTL